MGLQSEADDQRPEVCIPGTGALQQADIRAEKWIYLLKHMPNMKSIPAEFDEPLFKRLLREMLADGMSVDKIAKYTDLSIEEIEAL